MNVLWQDGSTTAEEDAKALVPVTHGGEHDFYPEQFVTRRADEDDAPVPDAAGPGLDERRRSLEEGARHRETAPVAEDEPTPAPAGTRADLVAALGGVPTAADGPRTPAPPTLRPLDASSVFGIVETIDPFERIARVRWLPPDAATAEDGMFSERHAGEGAAFTRAGARAAFERSAERHHLDTRRWRVAERRWVDLGDAAAAHEDEREEVSVYELDADEEYAYRAGDIVVRSGWSRPRGEVLSSDEGPGSDGGFDEEAEDEAEEEAGSDESDESDEEEEASEASEGNESESSSDESDEEKDSEKDSAEAAAPASAAPAAPASSASVSFARDPRASLGWVGEVLGPATSGADSTPGGLVRVAWASGEVSVVPPKFLFVAAASGEDDDSTDAGSLLSASDFDASASDGSWETLGDLNDAEGEEDGGGGAANPARSTAPGAEAAGVRADHLRRGVPEVSPGAAGARRRARRRRRIPRRSARSHRGGVERSQARGARGGVAPVERGVAAESRRRRRGAAADASAAGAERTPGRGPRIRTPAGAANATLDPPSNENENESAATDSTRRDGPVPRALAVRLRRARCRGTTRLARRRRSGRRSEARRRPGYVPGSAAAGAPRGNRRHGAFLRRARVAAAARERDGREPIRRGPAPPRNRNRNRTDGRRRGGARRAFRRRPAFRRRSAFRRRPAFVFVVPSVRVLERRGPRGGS